MRNFESFKICIFILLVSNKYEFKARYIDNFVKVTQWKLASIENFDFKNSGCCGSSNDNDDDDNDTIVYFFQLISVHNIY